MRRRRVVLVIGLLVALGTAGLELLVWATSEWPVTRSAFNAIEKGMTKEQVWTIMGCPPDDYTTRPIRYSPSLDARDLAKINEGIDPRKSWEHVQSQWWLGDAGFIVVWYGEDGRVFAQLHKTYEPERSLLDRVRRLLHL